MKKASGISAGPEERTPQKELEMPKTMISPPPVDARISGLAPDAEPAPPLRLTLGPISEDDELIYMRSVLRHYVRRFGADVVRQAVEQLAGGAR